MEVRVQLKPGVLDAEAAAVQKALGLLGIEGLGGVECARIYVLTFPGLSVERATAQARRAVEKLLANPVIHRVEIRHRSVP